MSFNIFGPATKKDIRVGYIDPDRGYVENVSILEANKYAALNPGTMFILKTRDATRYLTLNEVNALTPDALDVDGNVCDGIQGLRPGEREPFGPLSGTGSGTETNETQTGSDVNVSYDDGCRGRLFLSGGGGVGAVGSPIFGRDGSLLAVRVVRGGFGYKYPPKAKLVDSCRRGSGAVIRTIIGELPPTTEYFDQEEDFEIYDLTPDGTELSGYGLRYGVAGEILGNWDPNLFATLAADPIQLEINKYQDFLRQGINPFWHTRKENPISVTFRDKTTRVLHEVAHWEWGGKEITAKKSPPSEEEFFEDVKFKVFTQGGSQADRGLVFNFVAEDGSHKFKFTANSFKDSKTETVTKKVKRNTVYRITSTGSFRGKGTEQGLIGGLGRDAKEIKGNKKGSVIFADFVESSNDNDDLQVEATQGKFTASNERKRDGHSINDLTYTFGSTKDFKPKPKTKRVIEDSFMNRYAVSPTPASNAPGSDYAGQVATLEWEESFPYTGEYVFRGMADNVATLYLDNQELIKTRNFRGDPTDTIKKTIEEGVHRIKVDLLNIPIKEKVIVKPRGNGGVSGDLVISYRGLNSANKKLNVDGNKIKLKDGDGSDANAKFRIKSSTVNAKFSKDGKKISYTGSGKITLELEWDDNPKTAGVAVESIEVGGKVLKQKGERGKDSITIDVKGPSTPESPSKPTPTSSQNSQVTGTIFTTTDYIGKADRKLWRTNVYGRGGFLNEYGVCPFNTRKPLDGNPYAGTHTIRWDNIDFPADGNYNITVDVDDFAKISIDNGKGDVVNVENGRKKTTHTKFFKKGNYKIKADLLQVPGGRFSFDGDGKPKSNRITARFVNRDGKNYLKVDGSGTAEISFKLRVDDNPRTSGVFASKVKIGLPPNDYVLLSRSRSGRGYKEREVITGSDIFEAGREYLVDTIGSSSGTGSLIKNNGNTIEYDDNIDNGFDENADLSIAKIKNQQPSSVKGINPMALAIKIEPGELEQTRISSRTWYQNPMGAAFTIDAPLPPIPESPIPVGEGRCPKNPIWTTRFPGGQKKWWPVNHPAWSKFTNRFALSPLPPLSTLNSDGGGGVTYENTWPLEIPYDGFYGIKGTADNAGRILIDGQEVYKFKGFRNPSPKIEKVKLIAGKHEVKVEVVNFRQENAKIIKKKIFNTQDWSKPIKEGPPTPAELTVEYRGLNQGSTRTVSGEKSYAIRTEGASGTSGRRVVNGGKEVQFDDDADGGFDENASLKIESTSPGVSAKFNGDGTQMIVKGSGDVSLKFEWDDNPSTAGLSVGTLKVGNGEQVSWTSRQKGERGSDSKTINVGNNDTQEVIGKGGYKVSGNDVKMKDGHGDDINSTFSIVSSTVDAKFSSDGKKINYKGSGEITLRLKWDDNPKTAGKAVDSIAVGGKVWNQKGEKNSKTQTIKVTAESSATGGIQSGKSIGGVTYSGPDIFRYIDTRKNVWSDFMNKNSISPFIPPLTTDNPDIVGERTFTWSNVDFPENGSYEFEFQSDDVATLFINDQEVAVSKSFRGTPRKRFVNLSRGKYDLKVTLTNIQLPKDIFANYNPTGFALRIIKDVKKVISTPPWTANPLCASAIIIPPPCPKVIEGTGVVTDIIAEEPGNGYPIPPGGGPPVTLVLKEIIPTSPGINYGPEDLVLIDGKPLKPILGPFGTVDGVEPRPYYGITEYPNITMPSDTGVGFRGRPVFEPVIVPELVLPEDQLLQVTDLVGLKQTGYVNGRPYYGSTFSQDGILYAGVYETTGDLVQVYATLQESIDGQVTTRASAILRQGSDVTSNDPRLNIPNTPDNLV